MKKLTIHMWRRPLSVLLLAILTASLRGAVVDSLTFNGQADPKKASFVIQGSLKGDGQEEAEPRLIYSLSASTVVQIQREAITQTCDLKVRVLQGRIKELALALRGDGEITNAAGAEIRDWGVRMDAQGRKFLVLRVPDTGTNAPITNISAQVFARIPNPKLPLDFTPLSLTPESAALFEGGLEIRPSDAVELSLTNMSGLMMVKEEAPVRVEPSAQAGQPLRFRYVAAEFGLLVQVRERDADGRKVIWEKFKLIGELKEDRATFTLSGEAVVRHAEGGSVAVLSGDAALTSYPAGVELKYEQGCYWLKFRKPGNYPLELQFNAKVNTQDGWSSVRFDVVPSSLRPVLLRGLPGDTQFQFIGAAKPERQGEDFASFLPSSGRVELSWKATKAEELGKLFYAVDGTVHIAIGPGLLRQACILDYKVMQGELSQLVIDLAGQGEVMRVRGDDLLGWRVETGTNNQRRLVVQLNQPRKDTYRLSLQTQTPLGVFPLQVQPLRLTPAQTIRYGGHLMVVNDGAVRLEVTGLKGLSQISPELFPQSKELTELGGLKGTQMFAYRFAGGDFNLTLQADHILPELSISQVLLYHLGETETAIDAEIELDIREAPLREFTLRVPADYTVSRVNAAQLSDYFVTAETGAAGWSKLRLVFTNPLTGRQVIQLRMEKNQTASAGAWTLPAITAQGVKSVRGYIGVAADTGFRLTAGRLVGLTEIAGGLFPKKVAGLQQSWRLREDIWEAAVTIERLALSIQADVTHLFTVNDGLVYGSTVLNYLVAGAPVSVLKVAVPAEYSNVEFAGRDVRNWKTVEGVYEVYLHTPAYGTYTLLATYDRQFNARSNTVLFEGVRPVDAQSEQGNILVVSDLQVEVKPVQVSAGLLQLDPAEIPAEQRLLYDSPMLAAYHYSTRPYVVRLALNMLLPGESVHQVSDRAVLKSRVSREGEVVTDATYFIKSQGHTHVRVTVPPNTELWEVRVNGEKVVPVADHQATLIPLPPKTDASKILNVSLKLAGKSADKALVKLVTPALGMPILQTQWLLSPDEQYRIAFRAGSVEPVQAGQDRTGFTWLTRLWQGRLEGNRKTALLLIPMFLLVGSLLLRWATRAGSFRWSPAQLAGSLLGLAALVAALAYLGGLAEDASYFTRNLAPLARDLTILAPIQEAGQSLSAEVYNLPPGTRDWSLLAAWPAIIGLFLWIWTLVQGWEGAARKTGLMAGWTFLAWAALRSPNGAVAFVVLLMAWVVIHLVIPAFRCQWRVPVKVVPAAATAVLLLVAGLPALAAEATVGREESLKSIVQSVVQQAKVQGSHVVVSARLTWKTEAGQKLDFLMAPAVLTKVEYPQNALQLVESRTAGQPVYRLSAKEAGQFDVSFEYQVVLPKDPAALGFVLPTPPSLVNRLQLELERGEMEVSSTNAVSVEIGKAKRGDLEVTRADLVLAPASGSWIAWKPRGRDTRLEKTVFYAELFQLYIPTPGVVEGVHQVQIRPAQGQLEEVTFQIPAALTVTDVQADFIRSWRFDPDQHVLRVQFTAAQAKPFTVRLRSQMAAGTLPYEQVAGVITMSQAAGQIGMVGVATGSEVQLDSAKEQTMSVINLEDFPPALVGDTARQIPGLTLRRAFRYAEAAAQITMTASAVQPDVRVETQDTLSLGEDRTVLASQLAVSVTRAGIFKLSFALPKDFEVESLTGSALSHWTEMKVDGERVITLHLKGKTEGTQNFSVTLAGPGMASRKEWEAPRLLLREANKQTGQLVVVPEQGMRLHVKTRDGLTQLDPKKAGVPQKGVLAFRLLQARWQLGFEVETVEPWIQAASLQDVAIREGQALVTVNLDYQIENAGVKSFRVRVPARAENTRFEGDLISDSVKLASEDARWSDWEVKLQRRVIGNYPLRLTYQLAATNQAGDLKISGVRAASANLQRGFLALRAGGRLQITVPQIPATLQRAEWQSIPVSLRRGRDMTESKDTFTVMESDFELALVLTRHDVAKVLPARVESLDLTSVIAPSGEMLTEGRLLLHPGDKRLLRVKLPNAGQFWYAFVNGQSAWPWRDSGQVLLLLEKNSDPAKPTVVEFFYTCQTGTQPPRGFTHQALGPSFDLPLENITWNVYVPDAWQLQDWESSLQLRTQGQTVTPATVNLNSYLQNETVRFQQNAKEAEGLLQMGNDFLQKGTPQQARRAYQAAYKMSPQDAAFNEDARVQLNNLKMQQALLGLNQRRLSAFEYDKRDGKAAQRTPFSNWAAGQAPEYTQQQAQQALEQNVAEDNTALFKLAERLVRQQDAGGGKPGAIRAALPVQGRQYIFTGSLLVQQWADLKVKLDFKTHKPTQWATGVMILAGLFLALVLISLAMRDPAAIPASKP